MKSGSHNHSIDGRERLLITLMYAFTFVYIIQQIIREREDEQ